MADRQRGAAPGANEQVVLAVEQERQRESPMQPRQAGLHGANRIVHSVQFTRHELRHDLRVRLGLEANAIGLEFLAQFAEVLDDAVMDDCELVGRMRVGVGVRRPPMGRPARVADADAPFQRLFRQARFQVAQFAGRSPPLEMSLLERRDSGGIIAAVFETLQRFHDQGSHRRPAQDSNDAAHILVPVPWSDWVRPAPRRPA